MQHDVRHAQAASQAIFKESQALAAKLDAEHLERQAILAERVRIRFRLQGRGWHDLLTLPACHAYCQQCTGVAFGGAQGWVPSTSQHRQEPTSLVSYVCAQAVLHQHCRAAAAGSQLPAQGAVRMPSKPATELLWQSHAALHGHQGAEQAAGGWHCHHGRTCGPL